MVKQWKMGVFCKNVENRRCFCKKVDLSSPQDALCTVSVFFILHFTYLGGAYTPNAPRPPTGLFSVVVIFYFMYQINVTVLLLHVKMRVSDFHIRTELFPICVALICIYSHILASPASNTQRRICQNKFLPLDAMLAQYMLSSCVRLTVCLSQAIYISQSMLSSCVRLTD